ncbi:outer membrane protein assembly factor BamB family protein [Robertmurraya sp. GLU-23]
MSEVSFIRGFDVVWRKNQLPGYPKMSLKNNLVLAQIGGNLFGLDPSTGRELWEFKYPNQGYNINHISDYDDNIYCINNIGRSHHSETSRSSVLYNLNRANGEIIWNIKLSDHVNLPAVAGNEIVVIEFCGDLIGIDKKTGNKKWTLPTEGKQPIFLSIHKDMVIFVVSQRINSGESPGSIKHIYILDINTGKVNKKFEENTLIGKFYISKSHLFYECGTLDDLNYFYREFIKGISLKSLKELPSVLKVNNNDIIDIHNGTFYLLSDESLTCISFSNEIRWQKKIGFNPGHSITTFEAGVTYLKDGNCLFALNPATGEEYWKKELLPTNTVTIPFVYKGLIHDFALNYS